MSTIRETVTAAIGSGYSRQAEPALRALEAREAEQVEAARREMASLNVREDQQNRILIAVGLLPEPTPVTTTGSGNVERRIGALEAFARRHGFRS